MTQGTWEQEYEEARASAAQTIASLQNDLAVADQENEDARNADIIEDAAYEAHIVSLQAEVDRLLAELEAENPPPPEPANKIHLGMRTKPADWAAIEKAFGMKVEESRVYEDNFDPASIVTKIKKCQADGYYPYASMKTGPYLWTEIIAGKADADLLKLANALKALTFEYRFTTDHEPYGSGINGDISSPTALLNFSKATEYIIKFLRANGVGKNVRLGPCFNGHHFGLKWGTWTDAQLKTAIPDSLLAVCDDVSADFYDGATSLTNGEPAWVKAEQMALWLKRRGFKGTLGCGEWNFVKPADCLMFWDTMVKYEYTDAALFNSPENNRANIPTPSGTWVLDPKDGTGRHEAFVSILAKARAV